MKQITVKLDDREITVRKLPLGKYAELLKAIKQLPKKIQGLQGMENSQVLELLPTLIAESLPDFIAIITIATDLKAEEVEEMGLDEATRVVLAIVEVNNFKEVYDNVKKALARPAQNTLKPTTK